MNETDALKQRIAELEALVRSLENGWKCRHEGSISLIEEQRGTIAELEAELWQAKTKPQWRYPERDGNPETEGLYYAKYFAEKKWYVFDFWNCGRWYMDGIEVRPPYAYCPVPEPPEMA